MASSAIKKIIKLYPKSLIKPALTIVRKGRAVRCKTEMLFSPGKMKWFCPCCGVKFKAFIAENYKDDPEHYNPSRYKGLRQDVLCPCCKALPRHRILASWCDAHKDLFHSADILYFAPEYSMTLWMKRNGITCTTADLYTEADLKLDIQSTGLPSESYDIIICNHVLEHVEDFRAALHEVFRILRSGGSFICSFPMDPKVELLDEDPTVRTAKERVQRFGQHDHLRVFGMKADRFLREAGFTVETIAGEDYPEKILPIVGPADYDMNKLFWCRKV